MIVRVRERGGGGLRKHLRALLSVLAHAVHKHSHLEKYVFKFVSGYVRSPRGRGIARSSRKASVVETDLMIRPSYRDDELLGPRKNSPADTCQR